MIWDVYMEWGNTRAGFSEILKPNMLIMTQWILLDWKQLQRLDSQYTQHDDAMRHDCNDKEQLWMRVVRRASGCSVSC